ncbi:MAG: Holliday junction branch migration protein RuvA, partial [Deltaproteobacteria bacterium]|nr:Holliday junction branch migration protein RuvA [Deltaproteobacteria bacterium]
EVFVPLSTFYTLPNTGEKASLQIYTHVREDALTLFGFKTKLEKYLFLMLISISGIGPKLAVNILSGIGPKDLVAAIALGDALRLQAIPGVGKKTAERIALELKDRARRLFDGQEIAPLPDPEGPGKDLVNDTLSALLNLGYSSKQARQALDKARSVAEESTLEGLIREALKILA